jgi:hypothetical protein
MDPNKAVVVERQVAEWRDQGQLPFPDFAPDHKASIYDSIPYPPPESAVAKNQP